MHGRRARSTFFQEAGSPALADSRNFPSKAYLGFGQTSKGGGHQAADVQEVFGLPHACVSEDISCSGPASLPALAHYHLLQLCVRTRRLLAL